MKASLPLISIGLGLALLGALVFHFRGPLFSGSGESINSDSIQLPESGLHSDAFSLAFFQKQLELSKQGNVICAPCAVTALLQQLKSVGSPTAKQAIDQLGLSEEPPFCRSAPAISCALFADISLPFSDSAEARHVTRLSFKDLPQALSFISTFIEQQCGVSPQTALGSEAPIQNSSRFLAYAAQDFRKSFRYPFLRQACVKEDFDNANGSIPSVLMMQQRAPYRHVQAEDGSWEAIALPYKDEYRNGKTLYFIGILPTGNARRFAEELRIEQLDTIRQKLAESKAEPYGVMLPELHALASTQELKTRFLQMGLLPLFTQGESFSGICPQGLVLDNILFAGRFDMNAEGVPNNKENAQAQQQDCLRFDKPFLWLISDLETAAPPYLMGLIEAL